MSMMLPHNHKCVICAVLLALSLGSLSVAAHEMRRDSTCLAADNR